MGSPDCLQCSVSGGLVGLGLCPFGARYVIQCSYTSLCRPPGLSPPKASWFHLSGMLSVWMGVYGSGGRCSQQSVNWKGGGILTGSQSFQVYLSIHIHSLMCNYCCSPPSHPNSHHFCQLSLGLDVGLWFYGESWEPLLSLRLPSISLKSLEICHHLWVVYYRVVPNHFVSFYECYCCALGVGSWACGCVVTQDLHPFSLIQQWVSFSSPVTWH